MSILSGVVLMVAIGTVVQNSEQLGRIFRGEPSKPELNPDEFEAIANDLALIDVLGNDRALPDGVADRIVITSNPKCGRIFVKNGTVQYLPDGTCFGLQEFGYGISGSDIEPTTVMVRVRAQGRPTVLAETTPQPVAPEPASTPETGEAPVVASTSDTTDEPAAPQAVTTDAAHRPAPAEQPGALARAPDPVEQRAGSDAPVTPDAPGRRDEAASLGFGLMEPVTAPGGSDGLETPDTAAMDGNDDPRAPLAVDPWTDLAALNPPLAVPNEDKAGLLARSPLPRTKPATAPVYSPEELALADRLAAADRPDRPVVLRPSAEPDGLVEPTGSESNLLAIAPMRNGSGPRKLSAPALPRSDDEGDAEILAALSVGAPADGDPLGAATAPEVVIPGTLGADPVEDAGPSIADLASSGSAPAVGETPLGDITPSMALARIEIPRASRPPALQTGPVETLAITAPGGTDEPDLAHEVGSRIALAQPDGGLDPAAAPGKALGLVPVDPADPPLETTTDAPALSTATTTTGSAAESASERPADRKPDLEVLAALPSATEACIVPPGLTLDVGPAAMTAIDVYAPCQAGHAARLTYGELTLAVPIGPDGSGRLEVPGFAASMDATLDFGSGAPLDFSIPFDGIDKVERVAVVWDLPVTLDLHALEFGANPGTAGHVGPENARSYADVRRAGGGFLDSFAPVDGIGQHARVYTHYLRNGGDSGIVEMLLDFSDRREAKDGTCGEGALAKPGFTVLRVERGVMDRPLRRRLAAVDCSDATTQGKDMIKNAVKNVVIAHR